MRISDIIGLFAAVIGSTATLLGTWAYIRSQRPSKKEILRTVLAIVVIMVGILGFAVGISRATSITVNGQKTLPIPGVETSGETTPAPVLTSTPSSTPSTSSTPTPSSTPSTTLTPTPSTTPSTTLTPTPSTSSTPSSTPSTSSTPTISPTPAARNG